MLKEESGCHIIAATADSAKDSHSVAVGRTLVLRISIHYSKILFFSIPVCIVLLEHWILCYFVNFSFDVYNCLVGKEGEKMHIHIIHLASQWTRPPCLYYSAIGILIKSWSQRNQSWSRHWQLADNKDNS